MPAFELSEAGSRLGAVFPRMHAFYRLHGILRAAQRRDRSARPDTVVFVVLAKREIRPEHLEKYLHELGILQYLAVFIYRSVVPDACEKRIVVQILRSDYDSVGLDVRRSDEYSLRVPPSPLQLLGQLECQRAAQTVPEQREPAVFQIRLDRIGYLSHGFRKISHQILADAFLPARQLHGQDLEILSRTFLPSGKRTRAASGVRYAHELVSVLRDAAAAADIWCADLHRATSML